MALGRTAASSGRSSSSASRPAASIARSAARAWSGCASKTWSAAPASTMMTETLCAITSCSSRAIRACSSPTARRDACSIATRRLRTLSPSAQTTTGNAMAKRASSAGEVRKFSAVRASSAASAGSETRGGRAAASEPMVISAATGKTPYGAIRCTTSPPASAITMTSAGRDRRHHSAAP